MQQAIEATVAELEEATFGKIAKDNPEALAELLSQPEITVIIAIANPLGSMPDEWIKQKTTVLIEVMKEIRPSLANAILETPGGIEWFYNSLTGLKDILFGSLPT